MRATSLSAIAVVTVLCAAALGGCAKPRTGYPPVHGWCPFEPTQARITLTTPTASWSIEGAEAEKAYPDRAQRVNKNGSAYLVCGSSPEQASVCSLVREEGDYGFGRKALTLASRASYSTQTPVRVRFELLAPTHSTGTFDCDDPLMQRPPITEAADDRPQP